MKNKKEMKKVVFILVIILLLLILGIFFFVKFTGDAIKKSDISSPSSSNSLKTYLQGYVPNREIKINFLDLVREAEWDYCNDYECINMDLDQDYGQYGKVSVDYDVVLEDNQKAKKAIKIKLPQPRSDFQATMGRFDVQLPDVTPLYAIAEVGFAEGDTTPASGEAEIMIDDVDRNLILGRNFARTIPNSITDTMVMDISAFAGQEKTFRITFVMEPNRSLYSTNFYVKKLYIFTPKYNPELNKLPDKWWEYPQVDMTLWPLGVWKKFQATFTSWSEVPIQPFRQYAVENGLGTFKVLGLNSLGGEDFIDLESSRAWFEENDPEFIEQNKVKNMYGETLPEDHPAFIGLVGKYWFNSFIPKFRDYVDEEMNLAHYSGGYFFDETIGNTGLLECEGPSLLPDYDKCYTYYLPMDDITMSLFNKWLENNMNSQDFELLTGQSSFSNFNYRDWLISNNLDKLFMCRNPYPPTGRSRYDVPLSKEYELFLIDETINYWKERNDNTKNNGLATSGNIGFFPPLMKIFDLVIDEKDFLGRTWSDLMPHWRSPPVDKIGIVYPLLMNSILEKDSKHYLYDPGATEKYFTSYDSNSDLVKILMAQVYSSQSSYNFWPFSLSKEDQGKYNYNEISKYPKFILENQLPYTSLKSYGKVGIIFSEASYMGRSVLVTGNPNNGQGPDWRQNMFENWNLYGSFIGGAYMLLDSHMGFEVVYAGNGWWTDDKVSLQSLKKYNSIILPNTYCLTSNQINVLNQYMNNGGKILAFGEVATCDEHNNPLMTVGLDKTNTNFIYLRGDYSDNIGLDYFVDRKQQDLNTFSNALNQLTTSNIQTTASRDTSILTYLGKENKRFIIHIINNNYNENAKEMITQPAFKLTLTLPTGFSLQNKKAYLVSPDNNEVIELPIKKQGNKVVFNIPQVYIYSVLIITEENLFLSSRKLHEANLLSREAKWDDVYLIEEDKLLANALSAFNNGNYQNALQLSEQAYNAISKKIDLKNKAYAKIVECERIKSCNPTQAKELFYTGKYKEAIEAIN